MINIWRRFNKFPRMKPKEDGWYTCTVIHDAGESEPQKSVMDLYFDTWTSQWIDKRRQSVFDGYVAFMTGKAQLDGNRVYTDILCDRTNEVIAWKKLARPSIGGL